MAIPDPFIVQGDPDVNLVQIGAGPSSSTYSNEDASYKVLIDHVYGKRTRRKIQIRKAAITPSPTQPDINIPLGMTVELLFDVPANSAFSIASQKELFLMLTNSLDANSYEYLDSFLAGSY